MDYARAGYTRKLDRDCYPDFDRIFTVSGEVKDSFLQVYPECKEKTEIFHNLLDREKICKKALQEGGFSDGFTGTRLLTVGRLTAQKAYEVSIAAMKLLKEKKGNVRWYVLGEGNLRDKLQELIDQYGLTRDFILLGAKKNPYPYFAQTDIYVHASRFEGKSIAIQEAQILGCSIIVSDCSGNREQVEDGKDGLMCRLTPEDICDKIIRMMEDEVALERLQHILLFKELEFSLKDIKEILDSPDFDQSKALEQQIHLLELRKEHLQNLIDLARGIKMIGVKQMSFEVFDTKKIDE